MYLQPHDTESVDRPWQGPSAGEMAMPNTTLIMPIWQETDRSIRTDAEPEYEDAGYGDDEAGVQAH